jgi:hypothetical protein
MGAIEKLYQKLYTRVGGRPWTEIIREDQQDSPLGYMLIFLALGILLIKVCGQRWWWVALAFLFGVLIGHFWW